MTIGRATPAFSPFQWSPLPGLKTKPSYSNTHLSVFHEIGVILLIRHPRYVNLMSEIVAEFQHA